MSDIQESTMSYIAPIRELLYLNEKEKTTRLQLAHKHLLSQPDLGAFSWVTELDLRANEIRVIDEYRLPPNLKKLCLMQNSLTFIGELPESLRELDLSDNKLQSFDGKKYKNLETVNLSSNKLGEIDSFPENATNIDVSMNELISLPQLPRSLVYLNASNNILDKIVSIPDGLIYLNISNNAFEILPKMPDSIIELYASANYVDNVLSLPKNLDAMHLDQNNIGEIMCGFPPCITHINLAKNLLKEIPRLPDSVKIVDLSENKKLCDMPNLPKDLEDMSISYTGIKIDDIPLDVLKSENVAFSHEGITCQNHDPDDSPDSPNSYNGYDDDDFASVSLFNDDDSQYIASFGVKGSSDDDLSSIKTSVEPRTAVYPKTQRIDYTKRGGSLYDQTYEHIKNKDLYANKHHHTTHSTHHSSSTNYAHTGVNYGTQHSTNYGYGWWGGRSYYSYHVRDEDNPNYIPPEGEDLIL